MATRLSDIPDKAQKQPIRLSDIPDTPGFINGGSSQNRQIIDPSGPPMSLGDRVYQDIMYRLKGGIKEQIGSMAGSTAGGYGGGAAALALGQIPPFTALPEELLTVPLATLGATGGGWVGEGIHQYFDPYKEQGPGPRKREAFYGGLGELGGRLGQRLLSVFKRPSIESLGVADDFLSKGGRLLPSQVDDRAIPQLAEAAARGGITSNRVMTRFDDVINHKAIEYASELVDDILPGHNVGIEVVGKEFAESISRAVGKNSTGVTGRKLAQLNDYIGPLYNQADELTGATINPKTLHRAITNQGYGGISGVGSKTYSLKKFALEQMAADIEAGEALLTDTGRAQLKSILKMPEEIRFGTMNNLRSKWLRQSRQLSRDLNTDDTIITELSSLADDALFVAENSPNLPKEAKDILRKANETYRNSKAIIEKHFSYALADRLTKNPSDLLKAVIPEGGRRQGLPTSRLIEFKNAVTKNIATGELDQEGLLLWDRMGQAWVGAVIDDAAISGKLNPSAISRVLSNMGPDSIKILAGKKGYDALEKSLKLAKLSQLKASTSTLIIRSGQAGGAGLIWKGSDPDSPDGLAITAGLLLIMGPSAAARLLQSEAGYKVLTAGLKARPIDKEVGPLAVRMARLLIQGENDERKREKRAAMIEQNKQLRRSFGKEKTVNPQRVGLRKF